MPKSVDVVIPTKSYFLGLKRLVKQLESDNSIENIIIVADGEESLKSILTFEFPDNVKILSVPLSLGIHVMWNIGMDESRGSGNHICFINDDVSVGENCMSIMAGILDRRPEIGLITPNITTEDIGEFMPLNGFAGFCMMLSRELRNDFRFDERMKWWYGDNDIITWVHRVGNKQTGMTGLTSCSENQSYTINNDPPKNFHIDIHEDARIYHEKWGIVK